MALKSANTQASTASVVGAKRRPKICSLPNAEIEAILGDCTIIHTSADKFEAKYALVNFDDVIASHNEVNFRPNPLYPKDCQERNYHSDLQLKGNVSIRANAFEPTFLINNAPTAEDGSPIISTHGIVLGGNSRVMILKTVYNSRSSRLQEYYDELLDQLDVFGFGDKIRNESDLHGKMLVRIIDASKEKCSYFSRALNTSTKNELSLSAQAISYARQLSPHDKITLAAYISESTKDTIEGILADGDPTTKSIIQALKQAKVINTTNSNQFLNPQIPNSFSEIGKTLVGKMLVAMFLPNTDYLDTLQGADSLNKAILANIASLLIIKSLPAEYDITLSIPRLAIELSDWKGEQMEEMFNTKTPLTAIDKQLLKVLKMKKSNSRWVLDEYSNIIKIIAPQTTSMFSTPKLTPEQALQMAIDRVIDNKPINLGDKMGTNNIYKIFDEYGTWDVPAVQDYLEQFNKMLKSIDAPFIAVCPLKLQAENASKHPFEFYTSTKDGCGKVSLHKKVSEGKANDWLLKNGYEFSKIFGVEPIIRERAASIPCDEKIKFLEDTHKIEMNKMYQEMQNEIRQRDDTILKLRKQKNPEKFHDTAKKCPKKPKTIHVDTLNIKAEDDIDLKVNGKNLADKPRPKSKLKTSKMTAFQRFWAKLP